MGNPRKTAVQALWKLNRQAGYSNLIIDRAMEEDALEARDRGLATALFYGVLERRITLDYILEKFSSRSLDRLPGPVVEILRTGIYQLYFMGKIPAAAAVDESVRLTRLLGQETHSGYVNGVLRTAGREQKTLRYPDEKNSEMRFLEVKYSCPQALISLWRESYGREHALALLASLSGRPPLTVRVNTLKTTPEALKEKFEEEGVTAHFSSFPGALKLEGLSAVQKSPVYWAGLFHVQDLASQLCCDVLDPKPGEWVYDVCAAPGGKSFTCAERMEDRGALFSFDIYPQKVGLIEQGAARLGLSALSAVLRDAAAGSDDLPMADRVLCDLPCSGLGAIRRKPEIRYKPLSEFDELPGLQLSILNKTAAFVKPGGRLLYSTCTLNPAENGGVAKAFLRENPGFEPEPIVCPAGFESAIPEPENQRTLFPHIHGTDGFFLACFRKK